jgi:sulfite reductase alpha subunit-like flavoprotein
MCAQGLSFGVFGLGNKQYEHFCAVGKRVHKALCALGAAAVVPRGDGDDDEDIEADFDAWRTQLYAALDKSELLAKSSVRAHARSAILLCLYKNTSLLLLLSWPLHVVCAPPFA